LRLNGFFLCGGFAQSAVSFFLPQSFALGVAGFSG
jgi:hypothetical protein